MAVPNGLDETDNSRALEFLRERASIQPDMNNLAAYLNDHLAGSVAALQLLDRLMQTYEADPLGRFFHELRGEIEADQATLQQLIQNLSVHESKARQVAGWMAEKLSRTMIPLDKPQERDMGLFLALEALALGITGKHLLWQALSAASPNAPALAQVDYAALEARALAQRARVEIKRLEAASKALTSDEKQDG